MAVTNLLRSVILNDREQKALAWLLDASDKGQVISGYKLPDVTVLAGVRKRLGRSKQEHLMRAIRRSACSLTTD